MFSSKRLALTLIVTLFLATPTVFAQLGPGPTGLGVLNTQSPLPPGPGGGLANVLNFNQPVNLNQESQVALDPVNDRDIVPLKWFTKNYVTSGVTFTVSSNGTGGGGPISGSPGSLNLTGGSSGPIATGSTGITIATGPASTTTLIFMQVASSFTFTTGQQVASLQNSHQWVTGNTASFVPSAGFSQPTFTLNSIAVKAGSSLSGNPTITSNVAIPSSHVALLFIIGQCNGFDTPGTPTGGGTWSGETNVGGTGTPGAFCASGQTNDLYQYATLGTGLASGTTVTVPWTFAGAGYESIVLVLFDVNGWNQAASFGQCPSGTECVQGGTQTGTSTTPALGGASASATSNANTAILPVNLHSTNPTETFAATNGWQTFFPFNNVTGSPGPSAIQQSTACIITGASLCSGGPGFHAPAHTEIGFCTLAAGTCTVTLSPGFTANPATTFSWACIAEESTGTNAINVTLLTATTFSIRSASGADTANALWICTGY